MAERYERVFSLEGMLYTEGSPVIIEAGALLKDNQADSILAQFKFKSITDKAIKALTLSIKCFDVFDNELGVKEYQYLDLSAKRNDRFGSKEPIALDDNNTRKIVVSVTRVIFADNTVCEIPNELWMAIPEQKELELDEITLKYFKKDYSIVAEYEYLVFSDLWLCTCGGINHNNEDKCRLCKCSCKDLNNFDKEGFRLETTYKEAIELSSDNNILSKKKAVELLKSLGDYKDSDELITHWEKQISNLEKGKKQKKKFAIIFAVAVMIICVFAVFLVNLIIPTVKYNNAIKLAENGEYEKAIEIYTDLGEYKNSNTNLIDCKYQYANNLIEKEKYSEAKEILEDIKNYKESSKLIELLKFKTIKVNDIITLGKCTWIVLDVVDDKAFLLSEHALFDKAYHYKDVAITWEKCSLRKYLNGDFYEYTFNEYEKNLIINSKVSNKNNPEYNTPGGKDTFDKIYLLSIDEVKKYLITKEYLVNVNGNNVIIQDISEITYRNGKEVDSWYLRSPGDIKNRCAMVLGSSIYESGNLDVNKNSKYYRVNHEEAIRPCMWIDLRKV